MKAVIIILSILAVLYIYNILSYYPLNGDGLEFLGNASIMSSDNMIFGKTLSVYTPLGMWIYSLFIPLFGLYYQGYFMVSMLFIMLSAMVLYFIGIKLGLKKITAVIASLYFAVISLHTEGGAVILEPFCIFFGLISIYLVLSGGKYYAIAGVFLFLSYWSKQYGLYIIPAVMFYIRKPREILLYFSGFLICLFTVIGYYLYNGIPLHEIVSLLFSGRIVINMINGVEVQTGLYCDLHCYAKEIFRYATRCVPFAGIILLYFLQKRIINRNIMFVGILALCSLTPLVFAIYPHYFILTNPYIVLLGAIIFDKTVKRGNDYSKLFLVCFIMSTGFQIKFLVEYKSRWYKVRMEEKQPLKVVINQNNPEKLYFNQ
jgi:4-amino-4-deoxy-L-arabinose transferase-like glycosyltransferase